MARKQLAWVMLALIGLFLNAAQASAAERWRDRVRNHIQQAGSTSTTTTNRTPNGYTRNTVVTTADGKIATRDVVVAKDPATGTVTKQVQMKGPGGQTMTRETVVQKTESGHTSYTTITGPEGKTAVRDAVVVNDPATGTHTKNVTWTGPEGKTAKRETVVTKTENGYTSETTVTGPNGGVRTRTTTTTRNQAEGGSPAANPPE